MTNARDIIVTAITLFAVSIIIFVLTYTSSQIGSALNLVSAINQSNETMNAINSGLTTVNNSGDYIIFGVYMGITLSILITAYFVPAHPIFVAIYMIVGIIGVVLSSILSNVYETFVNTAVFGSTITTYPLASMLMSKLPIYITVLCFIGLIILFTKAYGGKGRFE